MCMYTNIPIHEHPECKNRTLYTHVVNISVQFIALVSE